MLTVWRLLGGGWWVSGSWIDLLVASKCCWLQSEVSREASGLALAALGLWVPVSGKTQGHIILSRSPLGLVVLTYYIAVYILMRDLLFVQHQSWIVSSFSVHLPKSCSACTAKSIKNRQQIEHRLHIWNFKWINTWTCLWMQPGEVACKSIEFSC